MLLCRRHHRLVHEGGFGVERNARGTIRFTRPDGRFIDQHPRLPASGGIDRLRDSISNKNSLPIDASEWVIPEGLIELDPAVNGLMRIENTQSLLIERPS